MPYGFLPPGPYYEGVRVNLRKCWRSHCNEEVDTHDDLGLCTEHISEMRDPDYFRELGEYEMDLPEPRRRV